MAHQHHPLSTVVDACLPLRFAPLPDIRTAEVLRVGDHSGIEHWHRADLIASDTVLNSAYDTLVSQNGPDHRLPATTHLMRALLREPIFLVASSIYLTGRAPLLSASELWFPTRGDRSFGTPMVTGAKVAVLPGDTFADHPDAVVAADTQALNRMAAEAMVNAFSPAIGALHAHTRMGLRTLWGWVVDTMCYYMLNPARFLGRDVSAAWERAERLADALVSAGAVIRARPRLFPFSQEHPRGIWAVRGTCCFEYKSDPEHGYCTTCPLKCDAQRRDELQEWLRNPALAP